MHEIAERAEFAVGARYSRSESKLPHPRKLERAGYISCSKYFKGRAPKTQYHPAPRGKRVLEEHL
jgi:hypothetical protein